MYSSPMAQRATLIWTERPDLARATVQAGPGTLGEEPPGLGRAGHGGSTGKRVRRGGLVELRVARQNSRRAAVDILHRRVWLWDGEDNAPLNWHLIVCSDVKSPKIINNCLSNSAAITPALRLGQM
jgi:hypothetical protein